MGVKKLVFLLSGIIFITQYTIATDSVRSAVTSKAFSRKNTVYNYSKELLKIGFGYILFNYVYKTNKFKESISEYLKNFDYKVVSIKNTKIQEQVQEGLDDNWFNLFSARLIQGIGLSFVAAGVQGLYT